MSLWKVMEKWNEIKEEPGKVDGMVGGKGRSNAK